MRKVSPYIVFFLMGAVLTSIAFYAFIPRTQNTYSGKHKIKGDGNSMTYTVQQIEELKSEWEKDCEKEIAKALKDQEREQKRSKREERKSKRKSKNND